MSKATPGPWTVEHIDSAGFTRVLSDASAQPEQICVVGPSSSVHRRVTARLIAAAPDMLQALKACEPFMRSGDVDTRGGKAELSRLARIARAAIAKATSNG